MTLVAPPRTEPLIVERRPPQILYRLSVGQYHDMIARGILPEGEPYELIDGQIVRKDRSALGEDAMTIGSRHAWVVTKLGDLSSKLKRLCCYMRTQQPIALPPYHEPEPDAVIVLGTADDYLERQPTADDVLCVIEVADSSLEHDRVTKQRVYADSGFRMYVIVNLPDRVIGVYSDPRTGKGRYGKVETLTTRHTIRFPAAGGKELPVPVRRLIP